MYTSIFKQKLKEQTLSYMVKYLKSRYPEIEELDVRETSFGIFIEMLIIKKDFRSKGIGTKVMSILMKYADRQRLPMVITPEKVPGGKLNRLIQFYKNLGFVNNSGRNKDYRFQHKLIRMPV